jgi:tetratricopeptide (TPR) repeat protein
MKTLKIFLIVLVVLGFSIYQFFQSNYWTKLNSDWLKKGHLMYHQASDDFAAQKIQEKLKSNPEDVESLMQLAREYHDNKNLQQAKSYLEKVLALKSDHIEAQARLADILAYEGNFDEAIISYERALASDIAGRFSTQIYFGLGLCYASKCQNDKAKEYIQKSCDLNPSHQPNCDEVIKNINNNKKCQK